jgi:hypothetical protein
LRRSFIEKKIVPTHLRDAGVQAAAAEANIRPRAGQAAAAAARHYSGSKKLVWRSYISI